MRSSFYEYLAETAPDLLPGRAQLSGRFPADLAPHATTILTMRTADGALMAGDRRATMGNLIAGREMEKVHAADEYSLIGFAGTAGVGQEFVRLFRVELEHYEKLEGAMLSLTAKANRLATMVRGNLPAAMQGLLAIPIFAGYDLDVADPARAGRLLSYDATGTIYEERDFGGIGSGSLFAKAALKKLYRPGMSGEEAARAAVEALYDAADDDTATGGPDVVRQVFPIVMVTTAEGVRRIPDAEVAAMAAEVLERRSV